MQQSLDSSEEFSSQLSQKLEKLGIDAKSVLLIDAVSAVVTLFDSAGVEKQGMDPPKSVLVIDVVVTVVELFESTFLEGLEKDSKSALPIDEVVPVVEPVDRVVILLH